MSYLPNSPIINFTFHDNDTTTGLGNELSITSGMSNMNIQFITSGTFTAKVEAKLIDEDVWYPYPSFKLPTYDLIQSTISDKSFIYNIDLNCITKLRVNITALTGSISVYGRAVS